MDNTLQKNIQFINDSGPPPTLLPSGTYVDITTAAQSEYSENLYGFINEKIVKRYLKDD